MKKFCKAIIGICTMSAVMFGSISFPVLNHSYTGNVSVYAADIAYEAEGGNIYINSSGYIKNADSGITSAVIPDTIDGIQIVGVARGAFYEHQNLESITLPDTVTTIETNAFSGCTNLKSINLSANTQRIYKYAFASCTSLEEIVMPDTVTMLDESVFYNCTGLKNVVLSNSVIAIDNTVFYNCTSLKSIDIPASVVSISPVAFGKCSSLEQINVDSSNEKYCSVNGVVYSKDMTELRNFPAGSSETTVNIPDSVTYISEYAFQNCTGLISVNIPDSVTEIANYAFYDCAGLKSINIPDSVTSMGHYVFPQCTELTKAKLPAHIKIISGGLFSGCAKLKNVTIPDEVTYIGNQVFANCTDLESVTIPASVTYIDPDIFDNCPQLVVRCYKDSYAEGYLKENSVPYEIIDENEDAGFIIGDADFDGKLTASDAAEILQKVLDEKHIMPIEYNIEDYAKLLDVDNDAQLTASDASLIMQKILNEKITMPIENTGIEQRKLNIDFAAWDTNNIGEWRLDVPATKYQHKAIAHLYKYGELIETYYAEEDMPDRGDLYEMEPDPKVRGYISFKDKMSEDPFAEYTFDITVLGDGCTTADSDTVTVDFEYIYEPRDVYVGNVFVSSNNLVQLIDTFEHDGFKCDIDTDYFEIIKEIETHDYFILPGSREGMIKNYRPIKSGETEIRLYYCENDILLWEKKYTLSVDEQLKVTVVKEAEIGDN